MRDRDKKDPGGVANPWHTPSFFLSFSHKNKRGCGPSCAPTYWHHFFLAWRWRESPSQVGL